MPPEHKKRVLGRSYFYLRPRRATSLAQEFDLTNLYYLCYKSHLVSHITSLELFILEIEIE